MRKSFWAVAGLALGTVLLLTVRPVAGMDPLLLRGPNPLIGKPLADFEIDDIDSEKQRFSAVRGEDRAFLFFWATWCPHCRTQLDVIKRNRQQLKDSGIKILLVNVGESRQQVAAYLQKNGLPLPEAYLDKDGSVSNTFGVTGLPTYIFVDENGIVAAVQHHLPQKLSEVY